MNIKVFAPAKINLGLEILDKRPDGYHNVDMIMQSVSLYDILNVSASKSGLIDIKSDVDFGCRLEDNIMYKAAECFFEFTGVKNLGVSIEIQKNIPSCAGLAGGSSDGAAVIVALNEIFDVNLSQKEMMKIGEKIGSDVPFCITGGAARATGRGTDLESIKSLAKYYLVISKPNINISTRFAYEKSENVKEKNILEIERLTFALKSGDLSEICANLFNRFEDVVHNSEIYLLKSKIMKLGAKGSLMTGSGSAVFGIFEDYESARSCYEFISKDYRQSFLCSPISHGVIIVG